MKRIVPDSLVAQGHSDFEILTEIERLILRQTGGVPALVEKYPPLLRETIDDVIQTARTGRRSYGDLEKTEKTYIGTRVEIFLRAMLKVKHGDILDLKLDNHEVDVKHTMASDWMIPREAINHVCILSAADERRAVCFLGLVVARPEYLRNSNNQDKKGSLSAEAFSHIRWLLKDLPYPPNFWSTIPHSAVEWIFGGPTGNERVRRLFREAQDRPIGRQVVEAVAQQKDPIRRVRADGGGGTRDQLAAEGIMLLSGDTDAPLIEALQLPKLGEGEYMSHKVRSEEEVLAGRSSKFPLPWPLDA